LYGLHDTETLIKKKDSYKHFATDKALYHIFSRMDDFKDSEDNK